MWLLSRSTGWGVGRSTCTTPTSSSGSGTRSCFAPPTCRRRSTSSTSRVATAWPPTVERTRRDHLTFGPDLDRQGSALQWVQPDDFRYLDPRLLRRRGHGGAAAWRSGVATRDRIVAARRADSRSAAAWPTIETGSPRAGAPTSIRSTSAAPSRATARRPLGQRLGFAREVLRRRGRRATTLRPSSGRSTCRAPIPLEQLANPFLRSRGALLVGEDFHYQMPGGGGVRGIDPRVSTRRRSWHSTSSWSARWSRGPRRGSSTGYRSRRSPTWRRGSADRRSRSPATGFASLATRGVGLRAEHRIGDTRFVTRVRSAAVREPAGAGAGPGAGRRPVRVSLGLQLPARALVGRRAIRRTLTVWSRPSSTSWMVGDGSRFPSSVASTIPLSASSGLENTIEYRAAAVAVLDAELPPLDRHAWVDRQGVALLLEAEYRLQSDPIHPARGSGVPGPATASKVPGGGVHVGRDDVGLHLVGLDLLLRSRRGRSG